MRRKIYKMICVAVACMSLTACDSWLDVDPSDQYSTETIIEDKRACERRYNGMLQRIETLAFIAYDGIRYVDSECDAL